jgi:hypothetical protein
MSNEGSTLTAKQVYDLQRELETLKDRLYDAMWPPLHERGGLGHQQAVEVAQKKVDQMLVQVEAAQAEIGGPIFRIPVENVADLNARIEKLNKKATKLDTPPITSKVVDVEVIERKRNGYTEVQEYAYVAVSGVAPKLNGWQFVATLEHDEGGTILRKVPTFEGEVDLTAYRQASPQDCDHCGYKRQRNDTYVVRHDDGTMKQVGSNCLKDFLGHQSPQQLARWAEYLRDLVSDLGNDEYEWNGPRIPATYYIAEYMTHVALMVREYGWVSKGVAYNDPTAYATAERADTNWYNMINQKRDRGVPMWTDPTEEDAETAEKVIEWAKNISEEETKRSDYLYNLSVIFKGDALKARQFGMAASAIKGYMNHIEREIKRQEEAKAPRLDEFVGEVKKREVFGPLTVTNVFTYENEFGTAHKHIFRDEQGRTLVWTTGTCYMDRGERVTLKGTVKAHSQHDKYGKQTILSRCKVEETHEPVEVS